MRSTHQHSKSSGKDLFIGPGPAIGLLILMVVAGAAYGIVEMQRGVDQLYAPFTPDDSVAVVGGPDRPQSADLPPIIVVGNRAHGRELFNMSCYVCHGPTGAGVPALGANLRQSRFIRTRTDQQLIAFIKMGRQPGDPNTLLNGTMPPKGGNPTLDDAGLQDVVAFLRSLQLDASAAVTGDSSTSSASTLR